MDVMLTFLISISISISFTFDFDGGAVSEVGLSLSLSERGCHDVWLVSQANTIIF